MASSTTHTRLALFCMVNGQMARLSLTDYPLAAREIAKADAEKQAASGLYTELRRIDVTTIETMLERFEP